MSWQASHSPRAKSISAEDTFDTDLTDRDRLGTEIDLLAARVGGRLRAAGLSGRTVTLKVRHHDVTTITRSHTRVRGRAGHAA
ncbi:hypothetical protein [Actinoplanes sp. NPDC051859]|uniref:DinB/UmuC family translesion DNA polymerase n=1 Tax=Actinoplanes sp. NPDC051859 TaxID=3363909 RepID=UPI0037A7DBBB